MEKLNYIEDIRSKLANKKSTLQYIPQKLLDLVGDEKFVYQDGKRIKTAYLVDIVHFLIMKYYFTKKNYFNLSSVILRQKYGTFYNFYMNYLKDKEIIEMLSNYCAGKKSKTYKIKGDIIKGRIRRYNNTDKILLKKYKRNVLSLDIEKTNYNWISTDIRQKLVNDLFYVDIDFDKSIDYLNQVEDKDTYNKNLYSIECIKNKHIFYHFDNYGRVHTNFTVLKSLIRKNCLSIDGEEVKELDIKNSQPLFLTILIQKNIDEIPVNKEEFEFFKDLVKKGQFYQYIMKEWGIDKRKEAKLIVYKVLFGRNMDDNENSIFKSLFPSIHKFIKSYKFLKDDYKALAYELQRSESNLLFNNIVKEVIEKYPSIKLFTIHDSISYPKSYSNKVEPIFEKNLNSLIQ